MLLEPRQLNKGEQLHALRRAIFYANEGYIRQRTPDRQSEQALCLAIVVNAIIAWNTVYIDRVLDELRASGELITTTEIEHISPLPHQHIHLYGHYPFDLASRPRRPPSTQDTRNGSGGCDLQRWLAGDLDRLMTVRSGRGSGECWYRRPPKRGATSGTRPAAARRQLANHGAERRVLGVEPVQPGSCNWRHAGRRAPDRI